MGKRCSRTVAALMAGLLLCLPAAAAAAPPGELPGPGAGMPAKAKAYGRYCQGQSRKPVEGQRGTPFSRCVTAMAKLAKGQADSPREACKQLSKQPVPGERGTPFGRCVRGAQQLLQDLEAA